MTSRKRYVLGNLIIATCTLLVAARDLTSEEQRGRHIYLHGTTPDGQGIVALLDDGATRVNGSVLPCASCHGPEGKGKNEGGVVSPDITWATLTKPYFVTRPSGSARPPYTERTLKRAVAMGLDSGGKPLQSVMPRFQLSYRDASDLIAFLKKLGRVSDPGLSDSVIRIGVILPPAERLPVMHRSVQKALSTYFAHLNKSDGGVYGRRIDLRFLDLPDSPTESAAAIREWLERESIFALTGSFLATAESDVAPVFNESGTPVICAFALDPGSSSIPLNPYVFYLDGGLRGELEELISLTKKEFASARVAVVAPPYDVTRKLAQDVKTNLSEDGWSVSEIVAEANGCRVPVTDPPIQVVFWITPQFSANALQECSSVVGKQAVFMVPGSFANPGLLQLHEALDHRVFVTVPVLNAAHNGAIRGSNLMALSARKWPNHDTSEASALVSANLLAWALRQAGRNVSRSRLVETLEGVYNLDFGLGFPVTYGPNRRVGGRANKPFVLDLRLHALVPVER